MSKSWYKQRCYYGGIDYLRRNNHHVSLEEYHLKYSESNLLSETYDKIDRINKLNQIKERASQILNPENYSIFKYYFIKGWTQKEIARKLHLTRACVAKKLQRMCHKIRSKFVVY
jgi:RNA polymerase sigma factor (sigma-70 family)